MNARDYQGTATEAQILASVLRAIRIHPLVVFAWRANSGAVQYDGGRYVKFAFKGCSDIMAVLKPTGRLCGLEVKRPGQRPTPDQAAFLSALAKAGGLSAVVHSASEALAVLDGELTYRQRHGTDPDTR